MNDFTQYPMFGFLLSLITFEIGLLIQRKSKLVFLNPLLLAIGMIIAILVIGKIPLEHYQKGGDVIGLFLGPATVVLAVPLYKQLEPLKRYAKEILIGICVGIITGFISTTICCIVFGLNQVVSASLMPKSITTPIGIVLSEQLGGVPAITVLTILVTGVCGAVIADVVFKVFKIKHPIAKGIALGTSAHAIGTTKALSLGDAEGAMSSLAIGVAGLITVFIAPTIWQIVLTLL